MVENKILQWHKKNRAKKSGYTREKRKRRTKAGVEGKYREIYTQGATDTQELNYGKAATKYGDAVYETSNGYSSSSASWYSDYAYFVYTTALFFVRGGYYNASAIAGLFAFGETNGSVDTYQGFRVSVSIL